MTCSASRAARGWPSSELPIEERETLDSGLRQIDFLDGEVALVDRAIAHDALNWPDARRLMTVPGVNLIVAVDLPGGGRRHPPLPRSAQAGRLPRAWIRRSASPATRPPATGTSPSRAPRAARHALVEASWSAVRTPGPLHAFYQRIRARRGHQVAITAAARKLACLFWALLWREQDYAFGQPSLTAKKTPPPGDHRRRAALARPPRRLDRRTACSATPNSTSPAKPSTPTRRPSATAKPPARSRRARARHRGAHHNSPRRAKPRGRPQAPDVCTSLRQSLAPTHTIPQEAPPSKPPLTFIRRRMGISPGRRAAVVASRLAGEGSFGRTSTTIGG